MKVLGGGALGLGLHEAGHLIFDVLFDADPGLKKVHFGPLPFFAIIHRSDLSPRREFTISSAGFWTQHGVNELLLMRRPDLRKSQNSYAKGLFAFNVLASVAYAGAALTHAGPYERDTRAMAASLSIDERWVGAMLLASALADGYRYFRPETRWASWGSRIAKAGMVVLVLKAGRSLEKPR